MFTPLMPARVRYTHAKVHPRQPLLPLACGCTANASPSPLTQPFRHPAIGTGTGTTSAPQPAEVSLHARHVLGTSDEKQIGFRTQPPVTCISAL